VSLCIFATESSSGRFLTIIIGKEMAKPTIIIVGGAWHTVDYLFLLAKVFEELGYSTKSIGLPSVGANPPVTDFSGDVAAVRNAAAEIVSENKDLIAVLHSFGGIVGSEALYGLEKKDDQVGVIAMVFIASMVPKKGHCFDDHLEAVGDLTWKPARQNFTQASICCYL
jgi:alpha-beta hydrolase superfamily lysophospholipase